MAKGKRYAIFARSSSALHEGSLSSCLKFLRACMDGYDSLTIVELEQ